VPGHPQLLAGYRALLGCAESLEKSDRVSKRRFFYRGSESCSRTEIVRYQQMLSRLQLGNSVLIAFDGGIQDEFDDTLFFKPPFGPYPKELRETFPVGQSEIPEWDDAMVRTGCRGIGCLMESHPKSRFVVSCKPCWEAIVRQELGTIEVRNDEI